MTFILQNFVRQTVGLNSGEVTLADSTVVGGPAIFSYANLADTAATIVAANYFSGVAFDLSVNDLIFITGSDSSGLYQVSAVDTAVNPPTVSVVSYQTIGSVGTANLVDDSVTYAKLQDSVGDNTLLGNPGGGAAAEFVEVTLGNGLDFSAGALEVQLSVGRFIAVAMTQAQWNAMYATPFQIIAAPAAGLMHVIDHMVVNEVAGSAATANGGAVGLQYGATAHLVGPHASATEAAADFNAAVVNTAFLLAGGMSTGAATSSAIAAAVTISNDTAPFITGTGGSYIVNVWYSTISAS